jgi:hypothetical protein
VPGAAGSGYPDAVTARGKRRLVILTIVIIGFGYVQAATRLEERRFEAQQPAVGAASTILRHVDRDRLMRDVAALSAPPFDGRRTGTPGALLARQWIVDRYADIPLKPAGVNGFLQPFSFTHRSARGLVTPGQPFTTEYSDAANVIGRLDGTSPAARPIVVSAHYDHLGNRDGAVYRGADDNASGVAAMLEAARFFKAHPPRHPMIFAAFDAEELGLRGAAAFVEARPEGRGAAMNVNLDMVSRNDRNEIFAAGTYHHPEFKPWIEDVQRRSAVRILFGHDRPMYLAGGVEDWTSSSDHGAFHAAGVPFIYFGVADHPDYHKPTDTADKIDPAFFGAAADMIVEALRTVDARLP